MTVSLAFQSQDSLRPLSFDPSKLKGLSERLIRLHWENNYGGAVIVIGQRSITDWVTAALALATASVLWRFKKVPEPAIVLVAAVVGLLVHPLSIHG